MCFIMSVLFFYPENKSYSSVRTEALSVVDFIVKRTGGKIVFVVTFLKCIPKFFIIFVHFVLYIHTIFSFKHINIIYMCIYCIHRSATKLKALTDEINKTDYLVKWHLKGDILGGKWTVRTEVHVKNGEVWGSEWLWQEWNSDCVRAGSLSGLILWKSYCSTKLTAARTLHHSFLWWITFSFTLCGRVPVPRLPGEEIAPGCTMGVKGPTQDWTGYTANVFVPDTRGHLKRFCRIYTLKGLSCLCSREQATQY